ncbi:hypothetical protein Cgig2_008688 [Carnegiea gigantea]|uniref:F-box protein n=1 Tax=Carnegiea gigantea TaxID=171969 RepID=A0A9Q1JXB0_9CARY|nr:hypothetical protein Cgig2_008688 [Carnegiea gigantea]
MVSLQASMNLTIRTSHANNAKSLVDGTTPSLRIRSAISIPKLPNGKLLKELNLSNVLLKNTRKLPLLESDSISIITPQDTKEGRHSATLTRKLYMILEAVSDRIEMHQNIKEQRENWNSLLLNSLNMVTLTAATMAGVAGVEGEHVLPLKVSSTLLFSAATGILLIMNKIQPSQLVEEQRNAVRLFKQLQAKIQTTLSLRSLTERDVEDAMERVLALDRAYPLPLLGAMLDKFPKTFEPARWWPSKKTPSSHQGDFCKSKKMRKNGWSEDLEKEMREIVGLINRKDIEDYVRLGNKALKLNKALAISGPVLTGIAAIGSVFAGQGGPWAALLAATAGSMASLVNTIEHGGQIGMVFEMYRNCAGFFRLLEERVESTLEVEDFEERENGELFEMKLALHLGRSLSELRDLAAKCKSSCGSYEGEFASKYAVL